MALIANKIVDLFVFNSKGFSSSIFTNMYMQIQKYIRKLCLQVVKPSLPPIV